MTTIHNGRISTTSKYHSVPAIPEFSLESLEYHYSDDDLQSVESHLSLSSRGRAERNKIPRTEGCLVTKQTGYHLEKAHWVNPVRKDPQIQYEVEQILIGLHIVPWFFNLNSTSNLAPLDRNLHYTLNRLGFFETVVASTALQALRRANRIDSRFGGEDLLPAYS
ncbi:hypothetical protein CPC08DRAFT_822306 [Agrocybe pediades]|nr:hypothetical protein CPC08DRAFT_822306 [Agrocybe pediades]